MVFVLLNASGARAATGYSLTDLTNGKDTAKHAVTAAQVEAVNDLGDVVGEASFADSIKTGGELEGFLYKGGVFHELHGDPSQGTAGPRTVALDINDSDDVAGTSYLGFSTTGGNASRMVFWPKGADTVIDPGLLPHNGLDQVAGTALNASGTIIGYANDSNLRSQAAESVRGGALTALTSTTTGFYFGVGISDAGMTALILDSGGGGIGTNTVGSTTLGFRLANFHALSHNGKYAIGDNSSGVGQELTPLGTITLPPLTGDTSSTPLGVNDNGNAVGFSESQSAVIRAVIWHDGQPTDLNTLVPNLPYRLVEAKDISDKGYIVGDGTGGTVNVGPVWELTPGEGGIGGTVTNDVGDAPLADGDVTVQATGSNGQVTTATTDGNGQYKLSVAPGTYTVAPEGSSFVPASRKVTVTGFTSNVDFTQEPAGVVTLGLEKLSFGVATYTIGIAPPIVGHGSSPSLPGFVVSKPLDHTSPRIAQDLMQGRLFPVAFLDLYQPGTTTIVATYQLTDASIDEVFYLGGQPPSESVTVRAKRANMIRVPACRPITPSPDVAPAADALVCPLTEAQKDAALAAYQKYSDDAANLRNSQDALGCFPHADREVRLACAAIGLMRAYDIQQETEAKQILDDPPDPHFKKVVKPKPVHPAKIAGKRFRAFNSLITALARIGSLERALVISANRESGAHNAKSKSGVKRQRSAISHYAKQIIALTRRITRLKAAAARPFTSLHTKTKPKQPVTLDFADLLAGDRDLATAMRPSAR